VIQPRILYGTHILSPSDSSLYLLNSIWHAAAQWILGALNSTPISSLLIEACLLPLNILFRAKKIQYAYRITCDDPHINITTLALPLDFPTAFSYYDPTSLTWRISNIRISHWTYPKPPLSRPLLIIYSVTHLLILWAFKPFHLCAPSVGPRPLANPTFLTKADFNAYTIFTIPPLLKYSTETVLSLCNLLVI
jgi:hypothetical protein